MRIIEKNDSNMILASMREAEKEVSVKREIPEGYVEVRLSTRGKVGAPEVFHIRNFKVKDVVALSLTDGNDTALRLISVLNDMIWEDVNVGDWSEKEVEETMVYVFITFFRSVLTDVAFPYNEEDLEELRKREDGEERVKAILEGKYVPRTDIDIVNGTDTYDIPEDFNSEITITNKKSGFYCTFTFIKYSDQITIRKWVDNFYSEEEAKFALLKRKIDLNNNILNNLKSNPESIQDIVEIDSEELEEYKEYSSRKVQTLAEAIKIISIVDYNGKDTRNLSMSEKYELMADDARIDFGMISKLNNRQQKMLYGIKPEVRMNNPIIGGVVSRPFSFHLSDLLQTMQLSGDDDYEDGYDA